MVNQKIKDELHLFLVDMKAMYEVFGKGLIGKMLILQAIFLIFAGVLYFKLSFSSVESLIFLFVPTLSFIVAYLMMYFSEYRSEFKQLRTDKKMESKYGGLIKKFMKTY